MSGFKRFAIDTATISGAMLIGAVLGVLGVTTRPAKPAAVTCTNVLTHTYFTIDNGTPEFTNYGFTVGNLRYFAVPGDMCVIVPSSEVPKQKEETLDERI